MRGKWPSPESHKTQSLLVLLCHLLSLARLPQESSRKSALWAQGDDSQLTPPQGGATASQDGGANAFFQADALWRGMLNPGKMAHWAVWDMDSGQEPWQLFLQPSPCMTPVYSELLVSLLASQRSADKGDFVC